MISSRLPPTPVSFRPPALWLRARKRIGGREKGPGFELGVGGEAELVVGLADGDSAGTPPRNQHLSPRVNSSICHIPYRSFCIPWCSQSRGRACCRRCAGVYFRAVPPAPCNAWHCTASTASMTWRQHSFTWRNGVRWSGPPR